MKKIIINEGTNGIYAYGGGDRRRREWWVSFLCRGERDRELRRRVDGSVSTTALSRLLSLSAEWRNRFISSAPSAVPT